jgi:ribosomal protein S18 acetylase RimI-like enzyme
MSDADFRAFVDAAIPAYAADKVASGQWSEGESLELACKVIEDLLPQGRLTADHYLFNVIDDAGTIVGTLWFAKKEQAGKHIAYIYDLLIRSEWRRQGYGRCALEAAEAEARRLGLCGIGLHVFGHNSGARLLYERLGYQTTNISMFKSL